MDDLHDRMTERRQVTVLFCDIVDSTGLAERCDIEDLREIFLEFQALSTRCIKGAGGIVVNYIGDGIRAEFGYPLASEHEAESAVRAGLLLLRGIQELGQRATAMIGEPLRVRIGLHTGVAVIGKAGRDHVHDATEIIGETPNIAFRLQELGEPNSLVISGETKRLLRDKFSLRPLGMRTLKGLSREMEAFFVLGEALEVEVAHRVRHHIALPLVSRVAELGQLLQAWDLAKTRRGHTVEITGDPGIGKSRLALELIVKTGLPDDLILTVHASAQHQNTPLYPIIRTLEQRIGIRRDEGAEANLARLREFLATTPVDDEERYVLIGRMLGLPVDDGSRATVPDAQELRRKTRDSVVQLLTSHAGGGPGLILVEDFQWADPSTIEIVGRIAGQIGNSPLLLVMTSRTPTLRSGSLTIRRIPLQRLDEDHCRDLAGSVVRDNPLPNPLIQQIIARSDGVPLFVEELAAAALETGKVDPGARTMFASGPAEVPSALYDSLMLRLERLGSDAKTVAQFASVIGRSFSHRLLAAVASEHQHSLEPALQRLRASGLVGRERNDEETVYSFKHALVRDVAYYSLLKRQRRQLHARVADEIEVQRPEIANREPGYLAQHLSEAGRTSRAAQMWLKAAKQAAERSANLEAVAQLDAALEEIGKLPAGLERDNLKLNAEIALIGPTIALKGYGADAVAEVGNRAIELCRAMDNDPRIFPALYARWSYLRVASDVRDAGTLARDFLALAEQKGTRADRMVGHRLLGTSLLDGETEKARDHLERATKLYDATADRETAITYGTDVHVTSLSNLCITCWLLGRVSEAIVHGRDALEYANQLSHAHTFGYAAAHVSMLHTLERDVRSVRLLAQRLLAGAIERELPLWASVARSFLGWSEVESGNLAEGIDTLEQQRDFFQTANLVYWLPTFLCWLAEAYVRADRLAEAKLCLEQARNVFGRGGNYWYEVECLRIEGRLAAHWQVNDATIAERYFEQALALANQRGQRGFALRAASGLAGLLATKGETGRARTLLQQELQFCVNQPDCGDRSDAAALLRSLPGETQN